MRVGINNLVIYMRRFWEATSGICYRTLQFADSQVKRGHHVAFFATRTGVFFF